MTFRKAQSWGFRQPPAPRILHDNRKENRMSNRRRYTADLRRASHRNRRIVCALPPYEGWVVEYRPRHRTDPEPWAADGMPYRLRGTECHAVPAAVLQQAAARPASCECPWYYEPARGVWTRGGRTPHCPDHGAHDHWSQQCAYEGQGPSAVWRCGWAG